MAIKVKEIPLTGKLRTADDGTTIGANDFQTLKNMRYGDVGPRGVGGQTKINTSALSQTAITNAHHFKKDTPAESHVLVQAGGSVWKNSTAVPSQGAFTGTALFTESSGYGTGRFSNAPAGMVAYANGVDTCLWGGSEMQVGRYLDWDSVGNTYKYDYTDQVINSLTDSNNVATIHRRSDTADANTMLLLHCDGADSSTTFTDSSPTTAHTVTAVGNAQLKVAQYKFGTASGYFDGTGDYLTVPDNADFDFSAGGSDGNFTIEVWGGVAVQEKFRLALITRRH